MSLGKGHLGAEALVAAQTKMEEAMEELREKHANDPDPEVERDQVASAAERRRMEMEEEAEAWAEREQAAAAAAGGDDGNAEDGSIQRGHDWEDADAELELLRKRRLAKLKKMKEQAEQQKAAGHGEYREIREDEFLKQVTSSRHVVLHFYHNDFPKCKVMDKHLRKCAPRLLSTKFLTIDAEKAPFFVNKLSVRVLPSVIVFDDGVAKERILGFQGLGGSDDIKTQSLVRRLMETGAVAEEEGQRYVDWLDQEEGAVPEGEYDGF